MLINDILANVSIFLSNWPNPAGGFSEHAAQHDTDRGVYQIICLARLLFGALLQHCCSVASSGSKLSKRGIRTNLDEPSLDPPLILTKQGLYLSG